MGLVEGRIAIHYGGKRGRPTARTGNGGRFQMWRASIRASAVRSDRPNINMLYRAAGVDSLPVAVNER